MDTYQYKYGDRPLKGHTIQRAVGRGGFGEVYYATLTVWVGTPQYMAPEVGCG